MSADIEMLLGGFKHCLDRLGAEIYARCAAGVAVALGGMWLHESWASFGGARQLPTTN